MNNYNNDFYKSLRKKITRWADSHEGHNSQWTEYILAIPDLFHLLCKLIADPNVSVVIKAKLGMAIAYFISPIDLIPEAILGPLGYTDDLVVAALVLNIIINETDPAIILKHWAGEQDILFLIKRIIDNSDQILSKNIFDKLKAMFNINRR